MKKKNIATTINEFLTDSDTSNNNMKISVKLEASENNGYHKFDLDDLGVSEQEWNALSQQEKHSIVEKAVFDLPEQPYWMVGSFDEI